MRHPVASVSVAGRRGAEKRGIAADVCLTPDRRRDDLLRAHATWPLAAEAHQNRMAQIDR